MGQAKEMWKKSLEYVGAVFEKYEEVSDIIRSDRPMKSLERDRRLLVIQAKKAPFLVRKYLEKVQI